MSEIPGFLSHVMACLTSETTRQMAVGNKYTQRTPVNGYFFKEKNIIDAISLNWRKLTFSLSEFSKAPLTTRVKDLDTA